MRCILALNGKLAAVLCFAAPSSCKRAVILSNGNDACCWVRGCGFLSQVGHVSRMLMLHVKSCSRAFDLWCYDKNPSQATTCKLAPQNKQGATVARENFPVVGVKSRDRETERERKRGKGEREWKEGRESVRGREEYRVNRGRETDKRSQSWSTGQSELHNKAQRMQMWIYKNK